MSVIYAKEYLKSILYVKTFLPEPHIAPTIPILKIKISNLRFISFLTYLTTICVNVRDRVCLFVRPLSLPRPLEVWKHEWYHVVTNCQGHVLSPSGLPKVAKKRQKKPKFAFPYKYS